MVTVPCDLFGQPFTGRGARSITEQTTRLVDVRMGLELVASVPGLPSNLHWPAHDIFDDTDPLSVWCCRVAAEVDDLTTATLEVVEQGYEPVDDVADIGVGAQVLLTPLKERQRLFFEQRSDQSGIQLIRPLAGSIDRKHPQR